MTTINTFYTKRNKLNEFKAEEPEEELSKSKSHLRVRSEDMNNTNNARISSLELKKEIPNYLTAAPSGRQEAFRLKNWVLEKEATLVESLKGNQEKSK